MAAGHSRRFGKNKLLAMLDGAPLITAVMAQLPKELLPETVVVTRYPEVQALAAARGLSVRMHNLPYQSDTIREGLLAKEHWDGCLFIPGDMPYLKAESLFAMLRAFSETPDQIVQLGWKGQGRNPVLFPRRCFSELMQLTGDTGGRVLLRTDALPIRIVEATEKRELMDVDVPSDLLN